MRIGVISDTHGLLRPEALAALAGSDRIVHAGDIGSSAILAALNEIAPVTAVRGNNDTANWADTIPDTAVLPVGETRLFVLHDLKTLKLDPATEGYRVVIAGHSHQPLMREAGGVLYLNPGSAGPRRFRLPISVARLTVSGADVVAEIIELDVASASKR